MSALTAILQDPFFLAAFEFFQTLLALPGMTLGILIRGILSLAGL